MQALLTEEETSKIATLSDGRKIHYNEAGSGPPVLFMHGSGPGATSWSNFAPNVQVVSKKFRCLLVDAPGFGQSDPMVITDEARSTVNARALRDLLDALAIERASIVGNSMGGGAGLAFAIDYQDRIDKLVVMGASGGGTGFYSQPPTEGIKILNETYRDPTVENFGRLVRIMVFDSSSVTDALLEERRGNAVSRQVHLDNYNKSATPVRDLYSDLPRIKAKVLMIHGRNDRTVPVEMGLLTMARIPGAQMHIFNECAHWAQLEKADQFNRLVADFLENS